VGVELGALGVVLETTLSGITALPFSAFASVVLPIHLVIGLVEGLVTAGVVLFVRTAQPEILTRGAQGDSLAGVDVRPVIVGLGIAAVIAVGVLAAFASNNPDGLEWSIAKVTRGQGVTATSPVQGTAERLQVKTAVMPGYGSKEWGLARAQDGTGLEQGAASSGLIGATVLIAVAVAGGAWLKRRRNARLR